MAKRSSGRSAGKQGLGMAAQTRPSEPIPTRLEQPSGIGQEDAPPTAENCQPQVVAGVERSEVAALSMDDVGSGQPRCEPTYDQVARRAREIWEQRGHDSSRDVENWLEAERQLKAETNGT